MQSIKHLQSVHPFSANSTLQGKVHNPLLSSPVPALFHKSMMQNNSRKQMFQYASSPCMACEERKKSTHTSTY